MLSRWVRYGALSLTTTLCASSCGSGRSATSPSPVQAAPTASVCPASIEMSSTDGGPVLVEFEALSNGASGTIACEPASGSLFPLGNTRVSCLWRDRVDAGCTFSVRVVADTDTLPGGPPPTDNPPPTDGPPPTEAPPPTDDLPPVEPPAAATRLTVSTILAFGDSITAGYVSPTAFTLLLEPQNSYPTLLEELLRTRFPSQNISVINRGTGRETSAEGNDRFLNEVDRYQPDLILILEGVNDLALGILAASLDGKPFDENGFTDGIVLNLSTMARRGSKRGAAVLLATLTPVEAAWRAANPDGDSAVDSLNRKIRSLGSELGAGPVETHGALEGTGLIGQDGLHPTRQGYEVVAQTFFEMIVSRFEKSVSATSPFE